MSEMVEKVARALSAASLKRLAKRGGEDGSQARWTLERPPELERHVSHSWAEFEDDARAAIATMRDVPDSVADKIRFKRFPHSRAVYEAIIDAALDRETVG